jgi:hypothetical protein
VPSQEPQAESEASKAAAAGPARIPELVPPAAEAPKPAAPRRRRRRKKAVAAATEPLQMEAVQI